MSDQLEAILYPPIDPAIRTVGQLAAKAHDVLEARGWCAGKFADPDGHVCLIGAINTAAYGNPEPTGTDDDFRTPAAVSVGDALVELGLLSLSSWHVGPTTAMYVWNDDQSPRRGGRGAEAVSEGLTAVAEAFADTPIPAAVES